MYPRRRTWNASDGTSSPDARHGLAAQVSPTLADLWQQIDHSLSDVPILAACLAAVGARR
jgi:hypothetical protein